MNLHRQAVAAVRDKSPIGQGRANMALGVVLGQLASVPGLPQKDRADYHDEALLALQQAVACDPADVDILYNLALVQVSLCKLARVQTQRYQGLTSAELVGGVDAYLGSHSVITLCNTPAGFAEQSFHEPGHTYDVLGYACCLVIAASSLASCTANICCAYLVTLALTHFHRLPS